MRAWDAVAEILKREGATELFAFPSNPLIDACADAGIRPWICRQERVGVGMADGYSRATGGRQTSVFAMQSGPGAENAFPGVAMAFADSTPILVIPMGLPAERANVSPSFDTARAFSGIAKSFERVVAPELLLPIMRRAFVALRSGRPGPVVVEVPSDIGVLEVDDVDRYRPPGRSRSAAEPQSVDEAARLLLGAQTPVIMSGLGVLYAHATDDLRELAELIQAPVTSTAGGKSGFPEDHPLSLGTAARTMSDQALHFLQTADVILAVGASLSRGSTVTANLPRQTTLIHSGVDPADIGKFYDVDCALVGDAQLVLRQLIEAIRDQLKVVREKPAERAAEVARLRRSWLEQWRPRLESNEIPLSPYRVVHDFMHEVNPADAIVTHDSGSPRDQVLPFYQASSPRSYLGWGKSHALGAGVGLAIGAKLARGDKLCVHFMGDAAFGMTGLDLETAVRSGAPTLSIVLSNSTMACELKTLTRSHELYHTRDLGGSYCDVARGLGLHAERVERPEQVRPAIQRAYRATRDGTPALIECVTNAEQVYPNYLALSAT